MAVVTVAKYGDRIAASPKQGEDDKTMIARLCDEHGAGAVFVNGVAASKLGVETDAPAIGPAAGRAPKKKASKKKPAGKK